MSVLQSFQTTTPRKRGISVVVLVVVLLATSPLAIAADSVREDAQELPTAAEPFPASGAPSGVASSGAASAEVSGDRELLRPELMQSRSAGDFIAENNLHRIAGYTTLALTAGTVTAGLLGLDLHPVFGLTTATAAVATSVLGTVAYSELLSAVWPHAVLNGVGVAGMLLNAFVFEGGSPAHIASGLVSAGAMAGAYLSIILIL